MPNTDSKPTSDKEQTQASQIYPQNSHYTQQIEDDSIDLYELWISLWNKKWLVIVVTAISALGSVVYALRQPPTYRAQALLLPPKTQDIQSLNVEGVHDTSSGAVFTAFQNNLNSRRLQKKFIEKHGLMEILSPGRTPETRDIETLQRFSKMIKSDIEVGEGIAVSMESGDPDFAAKLINNYISFFDKETIREQSANARFSIANKIQNIEYSINSKKQMEIVRREDRIRNLENSIFSKREKAKKQREDEIKKFENVINSERTMAKKQREDKIELYEEAAVIASNLGFRDMVETTNIVQNAQMETRNISSTPLYYRGFRALNAELELLKNRESDDPFIDSLRDLQVKVDQLRSRKSDDPFIFGLRDLQVELDQLRSRKVDHAFFPDLRALQEKLTLLRSIKIDEERQHAVTIDQAAYPPKSRIKPNRRRITFVGTSVGLFFGIFLAFFVSFIQRQKEIHSA